MSNSPTLTRRPLLWWDVGAAALSLLMCVPGGTGAVDWSGVGAGGEADEPVIGAAWATKLALSLGVLVTFVLLYVVLGRAALLRGMRDVAPDTRSYVYLGLLAVTLGLGTAIQPSYATLQALVYPMAWVIIGQYRNSVIWSGVIAAAIGIGSAVGYVRVQLEDPIWTALLIASLSFSFSVVLGSWFTRVFAQTDKYRTLVEELRASERQVAALSSEAGAAQERERLSRELHDTLTQTLAGLVMLSEQATRAFDVDDHARARDRLDRVESAAREAVVEARALVAATQPLGDGGLEAAIGRVAARLQVDTGLEISCSLTPVALDRELQVVLLRATQEGLANARKHARATRVEVTLASLPNNEVCLRISDDGVGPALDSQHSGFGLSGLAERVRVVGGSVEFGSGAERGALLEVRLPGGSP